MNFGPLGAEPHNALPAVYRTGSVLAYAALLTDPDRALAYAAEIQTYTAGEGLTWHYFATHGFATNEAQTPPSTWFEARIARRFEMSRSIPTNRDGIFGGVVARTFGDIAFANADGGLDELADTSVEGRRVVIRAGDVADGYGQWGRILEGVGDAWSFDGDTIRLSLQDTLTELRKPIQPNRYGGTGGAEGTEDLADRTKPLCFGRCFQVEPALIDPFRLIYQAHDGRIDDVLAVRDRGVPLTRQGEVPGGYDELAAQTVASGSYVVAKRTGMVRLGATPAGQLTADVRGAVLAERFRFLEPWSDGTLWADLTGWAETVAAHGYGETLAQITLTVLTRALSWGFDRIDDSSFSAMDVIQPAPMGISVDTGAEETVADLLQRLWTGAGAYGGITALGQMRLARLSAPSVQTPATLTSRDIVARSLERIDLPYRSPPLGFAVDYARNATTQRDSDLAGGVSLEDRQRWAEAARTVTRKDPERIVAHPNAKVVEIESHFAEKADADAEGQRLLALYAPGRVMLRLRTKFVGTFRLGRTLRIEHPRFGLSSGRNFVVIGVSEDLGRNEAELTLFG